MTPDTPNEPAGPDLRQRVAKARHDLRNPLAHILGFSEMLMEKTGDGTPDFLRSRFESIYGTADELVAEVNRSLDWERLETGPPAAVLRKRVREGAASMAAAADELARQTRALTPDPFSHDLEIIAGAARKLGEIADSALEFLIDEPSSGH